MSVLTRLFSIHLALATMLVPLSAQEHRNVHFYTGSGDIRWELLTHLILFDKSNLDANGDFSPPSASEAANIVRLRREAMLRGKTLIYGMAGGFSSYQPMLADAAKRAAYIEGVAKMIDIHELDGVDFDFEYPVTSADFALMDTFFNAMRARLGPKPLITADVAHWQVQMNTSTINNSLDWVQTMGYYFRSATQSADDLTRYANAGATRAKLCLGVPFAGKSQNSPTIPWDIGYNSLVGSVSPFDPAVNSVFYRDGDFQFVGVNLQKEKLRVAADGGGGTMVWHHVVDVTDSTRSVAVSLHEEAVRYVAPMDGFELPVGVSANALYQSGSATMQGSHTRVNGRSGAEVTFSFSGSLYSQSKVRSKDAVIPFGFPTGASIRLDYKVIDAASNINFYLRLRDSAGNYIQAPAYNVLASAGWKRIAFGRSSFSANSSFNENDIRSYEILGQYGATGTAFTSRIVLDNLAMISPHAALRPVPDADTDGFSDLLENHLGTSAVDPVATPAAEFAGIHAWWRLDEAAYPVCADASRGIHGMASGGTRVAGKSGNALQLDGVDDRILMAPAASLVGTVSFTLFAWVKTSDADGGVILQQRDASTNGYQGQYQLGITPQGTVSFMIYNGGFQFDFATTATIRDGQWHHVAAVRDGTEGRIFIDGVLAGQASGAVKSLEPLAVTVGCDYRDNIGFLNAALDDIRIYRRALNAQDLTAVAAFTPAVLADRSVSYDDRLPMGAAITTLAATGALPRSATVYRILAGDPSGQFQLDSSTGVLSLSRYPDATTSESRVLTMEAVTDGLSSSRSLANITLNLALFTKQDNTNVLKLGTSWSGGTAPGADNVALWNRTLIAASSVALGTDRSWHGLRIADPGGLVTIPAGNTLTLGASGIDMAAATQNLSIEANTLLGASQSWNVAPGRTLLRFGGTTTFNTGTTTLSGTGTVEFGGTQNLSGSGALVIEGGTLLNNLLGGTSNRSGDTTLNAGLIKIQTAVNLFGNGTLRLNGGAIGSGNTIARTVSTGLAIGGNTAIGGSGLGPGLVTFTGNTDLTGGSRSLTSNYATGLGAHFSGIVSNGSLLKAGEGILTLSGSNTFTGATSVDAGGLAIGLNGLSRSDAVGLSGATSRLFIGVNGTTTVNNLSGVSLASIRSDFTISGGNGTRALTVNQTSNGTFAGTFVEGGSRPISLTKIGSATLEMSGNSSYTGDTRVTQGVLKITGSLGTTAVTVANTATLAGNGNLGGSLTIQSGGIHTLDVASAPASQVTRTITGTLNLDSGNIINLTADTIPQNGTYILATAIGGITGTPGTVNLPSGLPGAVTVNGNKLELTVGDDFATWISGITLAPGADASATGDLDRDGLNNFTEYAFGLAPNSGVSVSPISTPPSRTAGTFSYTRRSISLSGLTFTYESSATLTGAWLPFTKVSETSNSTTPVEIITVGLPTSLLAKPALFIRVKAVK
jgi:autotransporter-associated beta strand protein